jgi:glycosyltransferase involved in cell wall biosynthesis
MVLKMEGFSNQNMDYITQVSKDSVLVHNFNYKPKVSFCIPTKNEGKYIKKCLDSILAQNYSDIEIVVVDGYSTDDTVKIAKEYGCKVYYDPVSLANSRQISIEKSSGEILAIWDADIIIPHENWLKNAVKCFKLSEQVSTVWPRIIAPSSGPWTQKCNRAHSNFVFKYRIKRVSGVFGGGNALFRRQHVSSVGSFDTSYNFGEDMILAKRLKDAGYVVIEYEEPLIHDTMDSLKAIYKRSLWGAQAFKLNGMEFYQQSKFDIFKEHYFLGLKGMFCGIFKGDFYWITYPAILFVKSLAYSKNILLARR